MAHTETTLSEKTIYTGNVFTVKERMSRLENGNEAKRELVLHNGGACIVALDEDFNIYLVTQFRSPFECELLEVPAGKLELGENPFEAAQRELKEETGFTASEYTDLGEVWPSVGFCTEIIYMYMARGLSKGSTAFDEDEFLSVVKMPFEKAYQMCLDGTIKDGKTTTAIMKAHGILKL